MITKYCPNPTLNHFKVD